MTGRPRPVALALFVLGGGALATAFLGFGPGVAQKKMRVEALASYRGAGDPEALRQDLLAAFRDYAAQRTWREAFLGLGLLFVAAGEAVLLLPRRGPR